MLIERFLPSCILAVGHWPAIRKDVMNLSWIHLKDARAHHAITFSPSEEQWGKRLSGFRSRKTWASLKQWPWVYRSHGLKVNKFHFPSCSAIRKHKTNFATNLQQDVKAYEMHTLTSLLVCRQFLFTCLFILMNFKDLTKELKGEHEEGGFAVHILLPVRTSRHVPFFFLIFSHTAQHGSLVLGPGWNPCPCSSSMES